MEIAVRVPYPRLADANSLITTSAVFRGMMYEVRDKTLIIYTKQNGILAVPLTAIREWAAELTDLQEYWDGVRR